MVDVPDDRFHPLPGDLVIAEIGDKLLTFSRTLQFAVDSPSGRVRMVGKAALPQPCRDPPLG
jgi:hypothetical protein